MPVSILDLFCSSDASELHNMQEHVNLGTLSAGKPAASADARRAVASAPSSTSDRFASAVGFRITSSMPQVNPVPCKNRLDSGCLVCSGCK
jgi:hypothetical protein